MPLFSFLKRNDARARDTAVGATPADLVAQARTRARRRLLGAVVLLGAGIVGFPLLFETQPRPLPVEVAIEIPRKDGAPPLVLPPASAPRVPGAPAVSRVQDEPLVEKAGEAGREVPPPVRPASVEPAPRVAQAASAVRPAASAPRPAASTPRPAASAPRAAVPPPAAVAKAPPAPPAKPEASERRTPAKEPVKEPVAVARDPIREVVREKERDKEIKDARKEPERAEAKADRRYVVQVGAFADAAAAGEARARAEKAGVATYTQEIQTEAGRRIRVRVGPFANREEADRAMGRLKAAGLPTALLPQ